MDIHFGAFVSNDVMISDDASIGMPDHACATAASAYADLHNARLHRVKQVHEGRRKNIGQGEWCCNGGCINLVALRCLCHSMPASLSIYLRCPMVTESVCKVLPRITSTETLFSTRSPT